MTGQRDWIEIINNCEVYTDAYSCAYETVEDEIM